MEAAEARMRFEVLGPLRVRRGGAELSLGGPKPRALLGVLLLHPREPVGIDELTESLWDGEPPASAPANLRAYVRTLRRALAAADNGEGATRVETAAPGYLIHVEPGELDLAEFEDLEARGRQAMQRGQTEVAALRWREALDLWRGAALADVRGGPRLSAAVVRLQERRLRIVEAWIDAQLALGAHAQLVSELRGLVATEPLHEPLWARLMVALHRSGRTADALTAFVEARDRLMSELGVEPGRQLQRIQRAILAGDGVVEVDEVVPDGAARPRTAPPASPPPDGQPAADVCPYQGLMPFDAAHAARYFGRERLVAELITYLSSQLTPPSLLAVVGPSGSGKSSLLRAGLLPALADGVLSAARDWPVVALTPGAQPLTALCDAVAGIQVPGDDPPRPEDLTDPHRLAEVIRDALGSRPDGTRLVMVVDQLEELFTLCRDERERQAFIAALCAAAGGGRSPVDAGPVPAVVVFGLRADFYGHCIGYPELIPVLSGGQVVVGPMAESELRHAIERPAAHAGLTLEPGLVEMLVADIGFDAEGGGRPEPGGLPLLSHALLTTWQLRDGQRLTVAGYRKAGGMRGAIAATAEEVYERLGPDEQTAVRRLFTRLVALGDATQDTSRRIRHDELLDGRSPADAQTIGAVLDALARARLIVLGSNTIEVAHEALITRWPRLQEWLTEDREGLRTHRQLTEAAYTWAGLGRDPGALYRGARLAVARQWAERNHHAGDMNALERAFLDASITQEAAEGVAERRRTTRSRQLVAAVLALLLVAAGGGGFALWQTQRNAAHERASRSQTLARGALGMAPERRPAAMLLAVEAFRAAPTPQARGALAALAPEDGYLDTLVPPGGWISGIAFSPDGAVLAAGNDDGSITLWDAAERTIEATFPAPGEASAMAIAFSPDGRMLASGQNDGTIALWDVAGRTQAGTLVARDGVPVMTVAFSPDGSMLASGRNDGTLVLWDLAEERRLATRDAGVPSEEIEEPLDSDSISDLAFSPDGDVLASGSRQGALVLWDTDERTRMATLEPEGAAAADRGAVEALAFSPDGATLAVAQPTAVAADPDADTVIMHPVAFWDVRRRAVSATIPYVLSSMTSLAFSPDGDTLATASTSGLELWDMAGGPASEPRFRYQSTTTGSTVFAPDGETVAVVAGGRAVVLLDPSSPQVVGGDTISRLAFSPDGSRLATAGAAPHIDLWDARSKEHLAELQDPGYLDGGLAFTSSGEWLGRAGYDLVVLHHVPQEEDYQAWKTLDRPEESMRPIAGGARSLVFSGQPRRAVVADSFHEMLLVWPPNGLPVEQPVPGLRTAVLSPNDDVLATASTSGVTLWTFPELTDPVEIGPLERFEAEPLVTFGGDGSTLATVDRDVVTLWDVAQRTSIASFTEDFTPTDVALAPDNRTVALAGPERVTVWDAVERVRVADLPQRSSIGGEVAFNDDGTVVVAPDQDTVRFWDLDPERVIARVCATLGRSLTRAEWAELLPDEPYRNTCAS